MIESTSIIITNHSNRVLVDQSTVNRSMNIFSLIKNESALPSAKNAFKAKNQWIDMAMEIDGADCTFSMVPKLFKLPDHAAFFHYKDAIDRQLVPAAKLQQQLANVEIQLRDMQAPAGTKSSGLFMPLPKPKQSVDGQVFYACSVCSLAMVTADHFAALQHVSRVQACDEYRAILQIAEQINPPPVGSKRSTVGSRPKTGSRLPSKHRRLRSKASVANRSSNASQKKLGHSYSSSNSRSSRSQSLRSAFKSRSVVRPAIMGNQSRCSTGEFVLSSKKLETPDFASRLFEGQLELDSHQTTSDICLQRLKTVTVRQAQFEARIGKPEVEEMETVVKGKEKQLADTVAQIRLILKC